MGGLKNFKRLLKKRGRTPILEFQHADGEGVYVEYKHKWYTVYDSSDGDVCIQFICKPKTALDIILGEHATPDD